MKILFIRLDPSLIHRMLHPQHILPPLSIGYSASILEANGHKVKLIDTFLREYTIEKLIEEIESNDPDIIGLDVVSPVVELSLKLSNLIKKYKNHIFIFSFGQHPSSLPATFLFSGSPINVCIIGEYEKTIEKLVEKIQNGENFKSLDGLAFFDEKKHCIVKTNSRKLIENLDELPFPKHEFFLNRNYNFFYPVKFFRKMKMGYILTSRGCPYECIFCSQTLRVSWGNKFRGRSPENVVDEIEYLVSQGVNTIYFIDDEFSLSKERIKKICEEILRRRLKVNWVAQIRADSVDFNIVKKMKESGCSTLCFGVESGSSRILKILRKGENMQQILDAFQLCKKVGILPVAFFMIGNPTETEKEIMKSMKFCRKLSPFMIQVAFFTRYPGAKAFDTIQKNYNIDFENFDHYNRIIYNQSEVSKNRLFQLRKKFYTRWLFRPKTIFQLFTLTPYYVVNFGMLKKLFWDAFKFLF